MEADRSAGDGLLTCWGSNICSQTGTGLSSTNVTAPAFVW